MELVSCWALRAVVSNNDLKNLKMKKKKGKKAFRLSQVQVSVGGVWLQGCLFQSVTPDTATLLKSLSASYICPKYLGRNDRTELLLLLLKEEEEFQANRKRHHVKNRFSLPAMELIYNAVHESCKLKDYRRSSAPTRGEQLSQSKHSKKSPQEREGKWKKGRGMWVADVERGFSSVAG